MSEDLYIVKDGVVKNIPPYDKLSDEEIVCLLNCLSRENERLKNENEILDNYVTHIEDSYEASHGMLLRNANWL